MSYEESARQVGAAADHELTLTRADLALQQSANVNGCATGVHGTVVPSSKPPTAREQLA